jgi:hypothetical protein
LAILYRTRALGPGCPGVVAAAGHSKGPAHCGNPVFVPVIRHEAVSHDDPFAK